MKNSVRSWVKRLIGEPSVPQNDKHLEANWHRDAVGGMWDEIGKLQFDFLRMQGLRPEHHFLDVGCGSLRGGVHFVRYLDSGNYYAIDINPHLLDAGRIELERHDLAHKELTLVQMENFDFQSLNQEFDYALAQSVFTHLSLNSIIRCIINIEKVLVQRGRFYATFFENSRGKFNLEPITYPNVDIPNLTTYSDKDPYHYDFKVFEWICEETSLRVDYIGNWNHPRDQKIMAFTKM